MIFAIRSARPTMTPHCGPPSNLSPLKVTRSAPASIVSRTVVSCGKPYWARSTRVPLPRSTAVGIARCAARGTSVSSSTLLVKPVIA
ncbi:hypothetical protein D3C86_2084250 [compost metagenome]